MKAVSEIPQLSIKELLSVEDFFQDYVKSGVWKIGFYDDEDSTLEYAGDAVVARLTRFLPSFKKSTKVLCIGAQAYNLGLHLVETYECKVEVFCDEDDISEAAYKKLEAQPRPDKMNLNKGSIMATPYDWDTFDFVLSVESLAFHTQKDRVLREVSYLLKPSGRVLFTVLHQQPSESENLLPWAEAMHVISLSDYQRIGRSIDLEQVLERDMTEHLLTHYRKLSKLLEQEKTKAQKQMGKATAAKFHDWLQAGILGLDKGNLGWGIVQFQKRNV
ncbi:MAG: methyltransferase domain-containing protein [Bacteroidetes bacterium]|nr:MAG: methyltransferase domain-containing protein [Bacteroidota bacterium]